MDRPSYSSAGMRGSAAQHSLMIQSSGLKPSAHSSLQMHGSGVTGSMRPRSATILQPSSSASSASHHHTTGGASPAVGTSSSSSSAASINQMLLASSQALATAGVGLQGTAMSRQSRSVAPSPTSSSLLASSHSHHDWNSTQNRASVPAATATGSGGAVPIVTPGSLLGTHKAFAPPSASSTSSTFHQSSSLLAAASTTITPSSPATVPVTISSISPFAAYPNAPANAIANAAANPSSPISSQFSSLSVSTNQPFTTSVSAHPHGVPHSSSASTNHPNESLIRQIEEQWNEYSRSIVAEHTKGGATPAAGGAPIIPGGAGSVSSLALLLNKLQSNQLWNFFEFTNHRQVLTIYGPSFDCLYYNPPPSLSNLSPLSPPVSTIYRDKNDYTSTLANIQYLTFKYVDFQLIALQLPLIKQKCTKLKSITFQANNIHSLFQLDLVALFAPVPTTTAASNMYHSNLEQMSLLQNSVTESPLYRSYLISVLCMNCFVPKDPSSLLLSPRSARGGSNKDTSKQSGSFLASVVSTNAIPPSVLDGRRISDEEIWESFECFSEMHRKKYYLNPIPNTGSMITNSPSHVPVLASSYWMDLLSELSLSNHGGHVALGTAANPLLSFPTSTAAPAPAISAIPLPLRPVNASSANRRAAKKLLEECCTRALATSARSREFEQEWAEVVHGDGNSGEQSNRGASTARMNNQGLIPSEVLRLQKSGISLHPSALAGSPSDPLSFLSGPINTPSSNLHSSNSAAALHRVTYDKTRIMKAYNNSANPTAVLGAMGAPAPAPIRRKKSTPMAN